MAKRKYKPATTPAIAGQGLSVMTAGMTPAATHSAQSAPPTVLIGCGGSASQSIASLPRNMIFAIALPPLFLLL
jgi:hypothetical protein